MFALTAPSFSQHAAQYHLPSSSSSHLDVAGPSHPSVFLKVACRSCSCTVLVITVAKAHPSTACHSHSAQDFTPNSISCCQFVAGVGCCPPQGIRPATCSSLASSRGRSGSIIAGSGAGSGTGPPWGAGHDESSPDSELVPCWDVLAACRVDALSIALCSFFPLVLRMFPAACRSLNFAARNSASSSSCVVRGGVPGGNWSCCAVCTPRWRSRAVASASFSPRTCARASACAYSSDLLPTANPDTPKPWSPKIRGALVEGFCQLEGSRGCVWGGKCPTTRWPASSGAVSHVQVGWNALPQQLDPNPGSLELFEIPPSRKHMSTISQRHSTA